MPGVCHARVGDGAVDSKADILLMLACLLELPAMPEFSDILCQCDVLPATAYRRVCWAFGRYFTFYQDFFYLHSFADSVTVL